MGWTTTDHYERFSKGLFSIREYLDREFASDHPDYPRLEIIDSSMTGKTEYYAALRSTDRKTGKIVVFALIVMVKYSTKAWDGHTLGWKEMGEGSMPYLFNCPERILKLLDPTTDTNAMEWRQKCRDHREAKRTVRIALQPGNVVLFEKPLMFPHGVERQRFTVEKHGRALRFRAEDGVLCAIPKAATMALGIVRAAA